MFRSSFIFILVIYYGQSAEVDLPFLTQCKIEDNKCFNDLWQNAIPYLSKGIPEFGMAPLDPMKITKNIKISIPNLFEINFIKGTMKGFKTCIVENHNWTHFNKGNIGAEIDFKCNIQIKGRYNATAMTNLLPGLTFDGLLKADGDAKLVLPNLKLKFILSFDVTKNDAGEIILVLKTPIGYKYQVTDAVTFEANKIFFDNQDISPLVVNLLNAGWRFVIDTYGAPFFEETMKIVGDVEKTFFLHVPATKFIADNIEKYVQ